MSFHDTSEKMRTITPDEYHKRVEILLECYNEILHFTSTLFLSREDAADAAQDAFVEALANIEKLRDPEKTKWWLYRIAKRAGIRYMKADMERREMEIPLETYDEQPGAYREFFRDEQMESLLRGMRKEEIGKSLAALSEKERRAIILYYVYGYKQKEIAEITGESLTNVKTLAKRGRDKIRENFPQEWTDDGE